MNNSRSRGKPISLLTIPCLVCCAVTVLAQEGRPRPPNPPVNLQIASTDSATKKRILPRSLINQKVEEAIARGNHENDNLRWSQAEKEYRRALILNSNEPRAYYGLGNSLYGRYAAQERAYKKALALKPDYADAHYGLAQVYYWKEKYVLAKQEFERAIGLKPDHAEAYSFLGGMYHGNKQYAEAVEPLKQALRLRSNMWDFQQLGESFFHLGKYEEGIEQFREEIRHYPDTGSSAVTGVHYWLGITYLARKRYVEAVKPLTESIRLSSTRSPGNYVVYALLGDAYYGLDRYLEAIESYQKSIELNSKYGVARYSLGLAYLMANNKTAAMEQYEALETLKSEYAGKLLSEINRP